MFKIIFEYDKQQGKWEVFAEGASNSVEALQGFNAVLLTYKDAIPEVACNKAELQFDNRYKISVGQRRTN